MRFWLILFILLGFPALEIFGLVKLADVIGWGLLLWLALSAFAGWTLIKEEKLAIAGRLLSALQSGQQPIYALLDSMRTLIAGVLLIFPGVISDGIAVILLLLPGSKVPSPAARDDAGEVIIEGEWKREEDSRLK
jgi:UPF0716 protein FxsA